MHRERPASVEDSVAHRRLNLYQNIDLDGPSYCVLPRVLYRYPRRRDHYNGSWANTTVVVATVYLSLGHYPPSTMCADEWQWPLSSRVNDPCGAMPRIQSNIDTLCRCCGSTTARLIADPCLPLLVVVCASPNAQSIGNELLANRMVIDCDEERRMRMRLRV